MVTGSPDLNEEKTLEIKTTTDRIKCVKRTGSSLFVRIVFRCMSIHWPLWGRRELAGLPLVGGAAGFLRLRPPAVLCLWTNSWRWISNVYKAIEMLKHFIFKNALTVIILNPHILLCLLEHKVLAQWWDTWTSQFPSFSDVSMMRFISLLPNNAQYSDWQWKHLYGTN